MAGIRRPVGYIGLGAMGGMLARRVLQVAQLHVWDLNQAQADALHRDGAVAMRSAAELAQRGDVIFLSLPRSADVEQVIFGVDGLIHGMTPGTLIVDQTSGTPGETRKIAARLRETGVSLIDAPVSGTPAAAAAGECSVLVSGADADIERATPYLQAISRKVLRCGSRVGDAQATKLVNNTINTGCRLASLEMVALGRKCGLDLAAITASLNEGRARNRPTQLMLPAVVQGRVATNFALKHVLKDMNQAMQLAMEQGVPVPIASSVRGTVQIGCNTLGDQATLEDVVGLVGSLSATQIAPGPVQAASPAGEPPASLLRLIDDVVAACNEWVTMEGLAVGVRNGLPMDLLVAAVRASSGWSRFLDDLDPSQPAKPHDANALHQAALQLRSAARIAFERGLTMLVVDQVRSRIEAALDMAAPRQNL